MTSIKDSNANHKFILFPIDIFSRYAFAEVLKNKGAEEVTNAFTKILKKASRVPHAVQTDKGKEFLNKKFQLALRSNKIHHYTTENDDIKATHVERLQRTIKEKIFCYFTHTGSNKYIKVLPHLIDSYNNTIHSALDEKPSAVKAEDQEELWIHQNIPADPAPPSAKFKYDIGDTVRISKHAYTFKKGQKGNWTLEVFKITGRKPTVPPTTSKTWEETV